MTHSLDFRQKILNRLRAVYPDSDSFKSLEKRLRKAELDTHEKRKLHRKEVQNHFDELVSSDLVQEDRQATSSFDSAEYSLTTIGMQGDLQIL